MSKPSPRGIPDSVVLRAREGDGRAGDALLREALPLVQSIATRLRCRPESRDDLVGAGLVGVAKALQRFETGRGACFATYAYKCASGEMMQFLRDRSRLIRIPWREQAKAENPDVFVYLPLEEWIPCGARWEEDVVTMLEAQRVIDALPHKRGGEPQARRRKQALAQHFGWVR
ncbi:MAG: hypothetical protein IT209_00825 [Armatimonadetes bacterium]|nr:hypothetical protein [Armatimonadota bacterium]